MKFLDASTIWNDVRVLRQFIIMLDEAVGHPTSLATNLVFSTIASAAAQGFSDTPLIDIAALKRPGDIFNYTQTKLHTFVFKTLQTLVRKLRKLCK